MFGIYFKVYIDLNRVEFIPLKNCVPNNCYEDSISVPVCFQTIMARLIQFLNLPFHKIFSTPLLMNDFFPYYCPIASLLMTKFVSTISSSQTKLVSAACLSQTKLVSTAFKYLYIYRQEQSFLASTYFVDRGSYWTDLREKDFLFTWSNGEHPPFTHWGPNQPG